MWFRPVIRYLFIQCEYNQLAGRKKDAVWFYFDEKKSACGRFNKAACKSCNKELMGIVARMKRHLETCVAEKDLNQNMDAEEVGGGAPRAQVTYYIFYLQYDFNFSYIL